MAMRTKLFLTGLALMAIIAASIVAARPYLPGTADLDMVRAKAMPRIEALLSEHDLTPGTPIFIRIFKASSELELWAEDGDHFRLIKTYLICNYSGDIGPKLKEGDRQSPEGFYSVSAEQLNPDSSFHLSFNLGFPNAYDQSHGRTGSYLMVHGKCSSIGCYAMTDKGIEEIYLFAEAALHAGQAAFEVHIFPFRMDAAVMAEYADHEWIGFWENLKEGHDLFETTGRPPSIRAVDQRYEFEDG